ncbi:MAG: exopolysaccharide biosynthesis polyprenyl glycosylphosphotransferase [Flavobacteriaceae bacterium]|nr:exopolysaccharide biosynthesis polyprenyl glycosylphosphotransferase [Flavobacteriaceae bacterium]
MSPTKSTHFEISERKILLRIVDFLLTGLSIWVSVEVFNLSYFGSLSNFYQWFLILGTYFVFFATVFELYDLQKAESKYRVFKNLVLVCLLTVLFFLATPVLTPSLPQNRYPIIYFFLILFSLIYLWRFAYIVLITAPRFYKRVLIIGDHFDINQIKHELEKNDPNYEIVGYIDSDFTNHIVTDVQKYALDNINSVVQHEKVSEIVVTNSLQGVNSQTYKKLLPLLENGYTIRAYTQVYEEITNKIPIENVKNDFYCYFPFSRSNQNKLYLAFTRIFDILISIIGLVFFIVILPVILIINLIGNRGPLFYKQVRVGKNGKHFEIVKLRSMIKEAENKGAQWATKNDLRVTKYGKMLRKTRLDEIPQFINVLKGDMSFIGPRPERPIFVEELAKEIPFYEIRHVIKPGLTGWAQVKAKYASSKEDSLEKLQYDLFYIKRRNIFLDLRILLKTMSTVVFFRGQ